MNKKKFIKLLRKYRKGLAEDEEKRFIESYYDLFETGAGIDSLMEREEIEELKTNIRENMRVKLSQEESGVVKVKKLYPRLTKVAAAALLIIIAGIALYKVSQRKISERPLLADHTKQAYPDEIKPGGNKAVLTLSGGQKIVLNNVSAGNLARQGTIDIRKQDSGEIVYQKTSGHTASEQELYNTISTPLGGEYKLVLADGTKVWLNAGSSLHFPIAFHGKERRVSLSGEAYFEIAKQKDQPFIVETGNEKILALGTSFNIKAYKNERTIKTTLTEGAIKIQSSDNNRILKPGEQASLNQATGEIQVIQANTEEVLAWKNGLFHFDNSNIREIMQEVSRWYNVEIQYKTGDLENKNFSGIISRYDDVSALLKRLELTGTVHFLVEGRIITVMD